MGSDMTDLWRVKYTNELGNNQPLVVGRNHSVNELVWTTLADIF